MIDPSKFPTVDDEYTPGQRRAILDAVKQARKGPYHGPFKNGAELEAYLAKWKASQKRLKLKKTG